MAESVLVIDPGLGINAADLAARWNADPDTSARATLEATAGRPGSFDPTLGTMALTIVTGVVTGVTVNILTDAIKRLLAGRREMVDFEIDHRRDAQGNEQFILRRKSSS